MRGRPQDGGLPLLRPADQPTPCGTCPKVPRDAPERTRAHAVEPTGRSWRAYRHYRECRAVGRFPDDPLVRRCAALVRQFEEVLERRPLEELLAFLGAKAGGA